MMYIYATETIEVNRVIDRFANAKKRRLLLLSRSVGMKLKFDRNIIAIIKLLVFKELPPFESSGYVPVSNSNLDDTPQAQLERLLQDNHDIFALMMMS